MNNNIENFFVFLRGMKTGSKVLILVTAVVALAIWIFGGQSEPGNNAGEVTTITQSSLEKILEINELSTVDYTYNAIAKAYDKDGTTVKYFVAYEGAVTAGIDFKKIEIEVIEEEKRVIITLPEVEIQDIRIDMGTMEYIFTKERYETETISQEAYKLSKADLENRLKEEKELYELAKENAIASVNALFAPWIKQIDEAYIVEVR